MIKQEKAITLIALIITIIILVILAAVSVRAVFNMGIVQHAINGAEGYSKAAKEEEEMMQKFGNELERIRGRIANSSNNSDPNEIVGIIKGLILRNSGKLTIVGEADLTNEELVEVNDTNLHEIEVATNVKALFGNGFFLTDDNKLYKYPTDDSLTNNVELVIDNVKCIINSVNNFSAENIYYLNNNNELYSYNYYGGSNVKIDENILNVQQVNNGGTTTQFFYTKTNGELYQYNPRTAGEYNASTYSTYKSGIIEYSNIAYMANVGNTNVGTNAFCYDNYGNLFSFFNSNSKIAGGRINTLSIDTIPEEFPANVHTQISYKSWKLALDNNGAAYLINDNNVINLSNDSSSPIYNKNIVKVASVYNNGFLVFLLVSSDNKAYCGKTNIHGDLEYFRDFKVVNDIEADKVYNFYYDNTLWKIGEKKTDEMATIYSVDDNNTITTGSRQTSNFTGNVKTYSDLLTNTSFYSKNSKINDVNSNPSFLYHVNKQGTYTYPEMTSCNCQIGGESYYLEFEKVNNKWMYSTEIFTGGGSV